MPHSWYARYSQCELQVVQGVFPASWTVMIAKGVWAILFRVHSRRTVTSVVPLLRTSSPVMDCRAPSRPPVTVNHVSYTPDRLSAELCLNAESRRALVAKMNRVCAPSEG
ncbi:hypothetical protein FN846DRAFT_891645 [Sphaerosporella brunnea]|uniref:Uncharacterized protein n=1 Tax=Sphaerosporella brunnea TaxID=1250544 RepID=A0A5J5ETE7_9PEZI|nr:hypothetical protein FN846DRAFT_891645 [Sphaerosporella brunnea]